MLVFLIMSFNSKTYLENRYKGDGNSGLGSYGREAKFKSDYINSVIKTKKIKTINDLGCGDGNQISQLTGFKRYCGYDVSETALFNCKKGFENKKQFNFVNRISEMNFSDLTMSLDVIYHIIEDNVYQEYMRNLFDLSLKYVLIYSTDNDSLKSGVEHIKHRKFSLWVSKNKFDFKLVEFYPYNKENNIGFYLFEK